ncbi:MAG TPA: SusC/RagA family TonB-linked outer membrane protein [Puia sp.]|nr:SusC/RagA family TonB-linked outer membrane protein [Puia sp.]
MRKCLVLTILLTAFAFLSRAQNREVTGTVTDSSGAPISGASINIKGKRGGTSAGPDGHFRIQVPPGGVLVISSVGFESQEVRPGSDDIVSVRLFQSSRALAEVVVTGVGVATSKKKVPIDVASLSSKDVAKSSIGSVEQALQGKIAGAQVQFTSGTPGQGASIILRGLNSLGDSYPLIMVDGIEVSTLTGLDLSTVDRVEVVKGAAAGMLYGAQGANGVIQIFTKHGMHNRKLEISVLSQVSQGNILKGKNNQLAKLHSFVTDAQGYATQGGARIQPDQFGSWPSPDLLDPSADPTVVQNKPYKEQTYDHLKQAYKTATTFNNSVSITGGGDRSDYAFTLSRYSEQNVLSNSYTRTSVAANVGFTLARGLTFRNSVSSIFTDENLLSGDADISVGGTSSDRFGLFNSYPFINFDATDSATHKYIVVSANQGDNTTKNPLSEKQWRNRNLSSDRIIENANLNYKFPKFLEIDYKYGIEIWNTSNFNFYHNQADAPQSSIAFWGQAVTGSILKSSSKLTKQNSLLTAYFKTDFEKDFHLDIPIKTVTQFTYDWRRSDQDGQYAYGTNIPTFPPFNVSVAQSHTSGDGVYPGDPLGMYTFVTYGYLLNQTIEYGDLVGISGGFRSDYSSAFGAGHTPFTFPRGTIYFRPSEVVKWGWLPDWKLRAAYGEAGIQPGVYDRQNALIVAQLGSLTTNSNSFQIPNTGLKVQQSKELEIGTDATVKTGWTNFLPSVNVSFSYWHHKNTDVIQLADLAASSGYTQKLDNLTTIDSRGIDLSIDANMVSVRDLQWDFGFRLGTSRSVATKINNGADIVNGIFTIRQGKPLGYFSYQAPLHSIDQLQEDGKTPYIDPADRGNYVVVNGNVVNKNTYSVVMGNPGDQKAVGNAYPDFTASFINTFTYKKNLTLSFQWDWFHGNKIYNEVRQWLYRDRLSSDFDKPVTINGTPGAYVAYYNSLYNSLSPSTWFVEDGSFLRLRDVSLTYNLSNGLHLKWAKNLSLTLSGRNLLTITKYSGLDPEATTNTDSQGNAPNAYSGALKGADYFQVPNLRSYQASLRVGF